ncbi:MAG TPA: hypothetical protein ENN87_14535 [Phycisphaerales bacterium]|nr:hypothetical protein [Phycisphaerales bacterium]
MECVMLARMDRVRTVEGLVGVFVKLDDAAGLAEACLYAVSGRFTHVFCGATALSTQERYEQVQDALARAGQTCQWLGITPVLVGHLWPVDGNVSELLLDAGHYARRIEALQTWANDLGPAWQTALDTEAYGRAGKTVPGSYDACALAQVIGGLTAPRPQYVWPAGSYKAEAGWLELLALLATTGRVTEHTLRRSQHATWSANPVYPAEVLFYSIMPDDPGHWTWADFFAQPGPRIALPLEGANRSFEKLQLATEIYR